MQINKWLTELPEITRPCLIVCAMYWGRWDFDFFEVDETLRLLKDDGWWGEFNEMNGDKYMIIDLPKKIKSEGWAFSHP
jgi:hypothetical protein